MSRKTKKIGFKRGQRVTRGAGFALSASGEVGTVVGQFNKTHMWVRWDSAPTCRQKFRAQWLKKV